MWRRLVLLILKLGTAKTADDGSRSDRLAAAWTTHEDTRRNLCPYGRPQEGDGDSSDNGRQEE